MAASSSLDRLARQLEDLASGAANARITQAAGAAGKKSALDALTHDLGGDRRFSGMRRKTALNVGFDAEGGSATVLKFRPAGLWILAESGRRQSGSIYPRGGRGKGKGAVRGRAVLTPSGPRASSSYGPSRGLHTFTTAVSDARRTVPDAAAKAIAVEISKF